MAPVLPSSTLHNATLGHLPNGTHPHPHHHCGRAASMVNSTLDAFPATVSSSSSPSPSSSSSSTASPQAVIAYGLYVCLGLGVLAALAVCVFSIFQYGAERYLRLKSKVSAGPGDCSEADAADSAADAAATTDGFVPTAVHGVPSAGLLGSRVSLTSSTTSIVGINANVDRPASSSWVAVAERLQRQQMPPEQAR